MRTEWRNGSLHMTASIGEGHISAAEAHERWIAERMKPALRYRALARATDSPSERRRLEQQALEIEQDVDSSREALLVLRGRDDSRGELRVSAVGMSPALRAERLRQLDAISSSLTGYAAVFFSPYNAGSQYKMAPRLLERIAPGAFRESLSDSHPIFCVWSHDMTRPLGSTAANTLRLSEDTKGLRFSLQPDSETSWGRDCFAAVKRGDVRGMSFAFKVTSQKYSREGAGDVRTILSAELIEVSPVAIPAYSGTSISVALRTGPRF